MSRATQHSVYHAKNISWNVGSRRILNDISFAVEQRQRVGIIGPNGAGKTSLLRCLSGLYSPSEGSLSLNGIAISDYPQKHFAQEVAVVSQLLPSQFNANVWDFVGLGVMPHKSLFDGITPNDRQRIEHALQETGIGALSHQAWQSLSGGEKQRAFIARALVQGASVLLMDEPSNHLDIAFQLQLFRLLKTLPLTVVMSLHDLNLAAAVCDHLLLLNKGKLIAQGEPKDVITTENLARCFKVTCEVNLSSTGKPQVHFDYDLLLSQHK